MTNGTSGINVELAEQEADRRWDGAQDRLRYSVEYAQSGIKSLFLANGGAILALLTFAGNTKKVIEPQALSWAFVAYGLGVFFALLAYFAGYFSQAYIMQMEFNLSRQATSDARGLGGSYEHTSWEKKGDLAVIVGVIVSVLSVLLFISGSFFGLDAVT